MPQASQRVVVFCLSIIGLCGPVLAHERVDFSTAVIVTEAHADPAVRKAVAHLDLKGPEEIRAERLLE